jgi:hypothetical protein
MNHPREGLEALEAEIARRESPDYQWFSKPNANQTPASRSGAAGARGMQHGELIGLKLAAHILSLESTDAPRAAIQTANTGTETGDSRTNGGSIG